MSAPMSVTSREMRGELGASSVQLHRWQQAGLIRAERWNINAHGGFVWPDWCWRMVALLRNPSTQGHTMRATMRQIAEVLAADPGALWVVLAEDGVAHACYEASEVVAIHRRQTCTTVVAIPTLEEARSC